jgi:cation diffusion facilitator family transporter
VTKGSATNGGAARRYAWLSIVAAVVTIGLKLGAYYLTGSVGLFSDAAESVVNLVAAVAALWALTFAVRPPDEEHTFGHNKAEYFSSGLESALIIVAAAWIGITAWGRLLDPQPLQNVRLGLSVTLVATALNGGVALVLLRAGRRLRSITLRADAQHLLTDVWTSAGVVLGVVLVQLTGWLVLDPLIGLLVTANIVWTGVRLLNDTAHGLLDTAVPQEELDRISVVLSRYEDDAVNFHAVRTAPFRLDARSCAWPLDRKAGSRSRREDRGRACERAPGKHDLLYPHRTLRGSRVFRRSKPGQRAP